MIRQGKGYILNISSITAKMPYPGISVYAPTKAFLRHYTRALRTEMKPYGVNVTCLIPGAVSTSLYGTDKYNKLSLRILGLMKTPENVASAGIRALFSNRSECMPGFLNRMIFFLLPLIPHSLISMINKRASMARYR
jgi:short-subunit dehydrogenase